jgi:hypothetical protein
MGRPFLDAVENAGVIPMMRAWLLRTTKRQY